MNKKGSKWIWLSVILLVVLVIVLFLYFALYKPNNERLYSSMGLTNPAENKSISEAVADFDERYVFYMLYSIKAYNLRDVPLTSNHPAIKIVLEDVNYTSVIIDGMIEFDDSGNEDIKIYSTKEELVSMLKDENYATESFKNGKSRIELISDKTTLFAKGYLSMYNELTGSSVTGGVIGIYTD